MSAKQFLDILDEIERQLDEGSLAIDSPDPELSRDGNRNLFNFANYDHRLRQNFWPHRATHAQTVTVQDLYRAVQTACARMRAQCQIEKYLGDNGFFVSVSLMRVNYPGLPFPSPAAVESEIIKDVRETSPQAMVQLIDQNDIAGTDPSTYRRRVVFRVVRGPTRSEVTR